MEASAWKHLLGKLLMQAYGVKLKSIVDFIKDRNNILARAINGKVLKSRETSVKSEITEMRQSLNENDHFFIDLDDVRLAMACLDLIRENFIRIDMALGLIEETYALFSKFNVSVPKEEQEKVDSLRYNFDLMIETVNS